MKVDSRIFSDTFTSFQKPQVSQSLSENVSRAADRNMAKQGPARPRQGPKCSQNAPHPFPRLSQRSCIHHHDNHFLAACYTQWRDGFHHAYSNFTLCEYHHPVLTVPSILICQVSTMALNPESWKYVVWIVFHHTSLPILSASSHHGQNTPSGWITQRCTEMCLSACGELKNAGRVTWRNGAFWNIICVHFHWEQVNAKTAIQSCNGWPIFSTNKMLGMSCKFYQVNHTWVVLLLW